MGVQRKPMQVNWLASFGLIILAGTLYRVRKVNSVLFKSQMKEIMQKLGLRLNNAKQQSILPDQVSSFKRGEWQEIKQRSDQYRFYQKIYKIVSSSDWLFVKKNHKKN